MMKFDLHMHTSRYSPDSVIDPFELVRRAQSIGLDGIVLTEHDRLWPEEELEELRHMAPGLVVIGGVEVSGRNGDVLCYGVSDLSDLKRGTPWGELCREVQAQGGVAVAAHPYRWGQDFEGLLKEQEAQLAGIELVSNNMDETIRKRAARFHARFPHYAGLGNSDAHELDVVGCCHTVFNVPIRNSQDLVQAIRDNAGRAVEGRPKRVSHPD